MHQYANLLDFRFSERKSTKVSDKNIKKNRIKGRGSIVVKICFFEEIKMENNSLQETHVEVVSRRCLMNNYAKSIKIRSISPLMELLHFKMSKVFASILGISL